MTDISLIWRNCMAYNMEGSEIYRMAEYMDKLTQKLFEKNFKCFSKKGLYGSQGNSGPDASNISLQDTKLKMSKFTSNLKKPDFHSVSLDEKLKLHRYVDQLDEKSMYKLLLLIQKEFPFVLEEVDESRLQIRMDLLTRDNFNKVKGLVQEILGISAF